MIYSNQANYPKALEFLQKSLLIKEKFGDQLERANCLNNIGIIYSRQGNNPKALEYYQKGLQIKEQFGDQYGIATYQNNIGVIYLQLGNYPKAFGYFQNSFQIKEQIGDKTGMSFADNNLSIVCLRLGKVLQAKMFARNGLQLAQEIKNFECIKDGAKCSYQADSALGDWKSAFEHHKLFKQYSDSLHNEEKSKEFGRIESKYQFEKEAEEAKRKETEAQRKEQLETQRRNNLQYLSIFAGLLVLFGGLAFIGKLKIPARVLDISLFAALLILFEFLLILSEPYIEQFSGGIPIQKLVFNSVIALGFAPLHGFLERKLKRRFASREE